jgi:hypothetical protein
MIICLITILYHKTKTMKKFSKFLLLFGIFSIVLSGCGKDESSNDNKPGNNALSGNVLKGKISDWTLGAGYTLKAISYSYFEDIGSSGISADGSFSITLGVPPNDYLSNISYYFPSPLSFSDPTSLSTGIELEINSIDGNVIGYLERSNDKSNTEKGYAIVQYLYVSQTTTVKGTYTSSYNETGKFNLNLKAGWNTIAYKVTNVSGNTLTYGVGNTEPSGVKWIYSSK